MLILLGYLVVLGTVFGGYLMTGGSLGALYQPAELVIIAGAGIGSFIVGNNGKAIKGTLKALPLLLRRKRFLHLFVSNTESISAQASIVKAGAWSIRS